MCTGLVGLHYSVKESEGVGGIMGSKAMPLLNISNFCALTLRGLVEKELMNNMQKQENDDCLC